MHRWHASGIYRRGGRHEQDSCAVLLSAQDSCAVLLSALVPAQL